MKKLFITQMILFVANFALAETLDFHFDDPVGDHTGIVDVVSMDFTFDDVSGAYTILLTADPANPFVGNFRININLYNPDTGTTAYDPSSFHDYVNDYDLSSPVPAIELTGTDSSLTQWKEGDRVAISTLPFGNPDYISGFGSDVADLPYGDSYSGDNIAEGEFTFIGSPSIIPPGEEETLYVPGEYPTLRAAMLAAKSGDHIEVAPGTYYERINFDGKALHLYSSAGPTITTINGGQTGTIVYCNNSVASDTILEGFTITGGPERPFTGGSGMCNWGGSPTVVNCVFSGNSSYNGGGMSNWEASPTVVNCMFTDNSASYIYGDGGGIYTYNGSPTVIDCTFSNNSANHRGGGICNASSSATILNCTFENNEATDGGGITNFSSSVTITNCAFEGNTAQDGGAAYNWYSSTNFTNCTITNNLADFGGGMHNVGSSIPTVTNCIVWGNSPDNIFGPADISYSAIEGGWLGDGNIDSDPLFIAGSLRLSEGSPCIDAGTNTPAGGLPSTDIDGNPRIINGIVDMGAYEAPAPGPEALLEYLRAFILEAIESGSIDSTMEVSLIAKVDLALEALADGNPNNPTVAINNMEALINHTEAQTGNKVTTEAAAEIISIANQIIEAVAEL